MLAESFRVAVSLVNSVCLLLIGFRSFQSLKVFVQRGNDGGRLPTMPEFDSDDETDDAKGNKDKEQESSRNPISSLLSWFHYWTLFAVLRAMEVHVSSQCATLLLFINIIVLSNQTVGKKLTETLYQASVSPLCTVLENNVAPHGDKFVKFFNTSFAQAVRGIHTQFITLSVPNASDELLSELEVHTREIKALIQSERRRRELEELSLPKGSSTDDSHGGVDSFEMNRPRTAKKDTGLRKRKGMRQSLGLW